uniref:Amidohydrolase 3 domain-containing protein n=1 Tax=Moniliophthora roreri TaxID=221103 RepID=A0A0W0F778_MONRR
MPRFIAWSALILVVAVLYSKLFVLKDAYIICSLPGSQSIYTVNAENSVSECLLVYSSRIFATGSLDTLHLEWHMSSLIGKFAGSLLLQRSTPPVRYLPPHSVVIPGLSDSHAHILEYGKTAQLPLEGARTITDTVKRVREYIISHKDIYDDPSKIILGGGWDHASWPNGTWPTAADLDADPVIQGRQVILQSKDCHALWLSTAALAQCGDLEALPQIIEGGVIIRDLDGHPTGVLLDSAQELIELPEPTEADLQQRFYATVNDALSYGLTSIHDAGLDPISLEFFEREAKRRTLPVRVYAMKHFDEREEYWGGSTRPYSGARLSVRSVKIFADGALRTGGAALHHHYHDNPSTNGFMRIPKDVLFDVIPRYMKDGWQVNVHAIGDRANGVVLDAFEEALKDANVTALRPRLEHAQIISKEDVERLGKLGVIASIQPTHAISDMSYAEDRLGPERVRNLYAFRSIISSGARITLGTDFPVEDINPFKTFFAAITRTTPDGHSPHGDGGWFPEQCLTREETLRGMTIDPAYASFTESTLGSIEPGKLADFVVLSQDIMTVPVQEITKTKVLATVIDGKVVYGEF